MSHLARPPCTHRGSGGGQGRVEGTDGEKHALAAEAVLAQSRIAQLKARPANLLDLRLDGELTKENYAAKKAEIDLDAAKLTHKLDQMQVVLERRDDDLEQALWLANELPVLWKCGDEEERRKLLEAVLVRVTVKDRRIAASDLRPPYSWVVSLAGEPSTPAV